MEQQKRSVNWVIRIGELWCKLMHTAPMWPMRGNYLCRTCGRSYPVPWAGGRGRVVESGA